MRIALIIHGAEGSSQENWFPWLKGQLQDRGYRVWVPDMPHPDKPSMKLWTQYIMGNSAWHVHKDSVIVGHSAGAVVALGLLQALPEGLQIHSAYMVAAFRDDLGWPTLTGLFTHPFDFAKMHSRAKHLYFLHSDNDPYCPLDHARYLSNAVSGELVILKGQRHFSVSTAGAHYRKFPYLLEHIADHSATR